MRKRVFRLLPVVVTINFCSLLVFSCNEKAEQHAPSVETEKAQYKCPMNCSPQLFDKPGKCPVCGMELEKVVKS